MRIEAATMADWPQIEQIYREGIRTGNATFETEDNIPDGETWFANKIPELIFKSVSDERVTGWAALTAVSSRCVYQGVAEVSVYVARSAWGQGIGKQLMQHLITASEQAGIWTLQSGILAENDISIQLHQQVGFRIVGRREKLGRLNGVWRDVVLMERRSPVVM